MTKTPMYVLLADDDKDDCEIFSDALQELDAVTVLKTVHDGEQLMDFLRNKLEVLPHVLFLDLNMPRKNGLECLSEIKVNERLKHLPVIIFSTSMDDKMVFQLYKTGAQYYIRKPNEFTKLKKVIHNALSTTAAASTNNTIKDFVLQP